MLIREKIQTNELNTLIPQAAFSKHSRGRKIKENDENLDLFKMEQKYFALFFGL